MIARRGKNKQKQYDLRLVGLAMVVTRNDMIPFYHKQLVEDAVCNFKEYDVDGSKMQGYRDKRIIWGQERTVDIIKAYYGQSKIEHALFNNFV